MAKIGEERKHVDDLFETANQEFIAEQNRVRETIEQQQNVVTKLVKDFEEKLKAVQEGNLNTVAGKLANLEGYFASQHSEFMKAYDENRIKLETEVFRLGNEIRGAGMAYQHRLEAIEAHLRSGGSPNTGGGGGARVRVPDPGAWKLRVLKSRTDNFHEWRNDVEQQLGSVWIGLNRLLKHLREAPKIVNERTFEILRDECSPIPPGSNPADWSFLYLRRKIWAVLYSHMDTEPRSVVELADECGFEAYRLIHRKYDPVTADVEYALLENVFKIGSWTAKTVYEEHAAFREATKRLTELKRRVPATNMDAQKAVVAGMMYANIIGQQTKKHILAAETALEKSGEKKVLRTDFDELQRLVGGLKNLEDCSRPVKMDISAASAVEPATGWTAEEWENWHAEGCPEEEPAPSYAEEPAPALDAVGNVRMVRARARLARATATGAVEKEATATGTVEKETRTAKVRVLVLGSRSVHAITVEKLGILRGNAQNPRRARAKEAQTVSTAQRRKQGRSPPQLLRQQQLRKPLEPLPR